VNLSFTAYAGLSALVFSNFCHFQTSVLVADSSVRHVLTVDAFDGSVIEHFIFTSLAGLDAVSFHQCLPEWIDLLSSLVAFAFIEVPLASFFRDGVNDLVRSPEAGLLAVILRDDHTFSEQVRAPTLTSSVRTTPLLGHEFLSPGRKFVILNACRSNWPVVGVSDGITRFSVRNDRSDVIVEGLLILKGLDWSITSTRRICELNLFVVFGHGGGRDGNSIDSQGCQC